MGLSDTFTFSGVPAGTYTLSLRASNGTGAGGSSNAVTLTFPGPCSGAPLPPTNFLAYKSGTTIFVVWDPPTGGPAATGYVLNVSGSLSGSFPTTGSRAERHRWSGEVQPQRLGEQRVRRWQRDEPTGRDDSVSSASGASVPPVLRRSPP